MMILEWLTFWATLYFRIWCSSSRGLCYW